MKHRTLGYSLIELMVAITLGLVLLAGVIQVFINSEQGYAVQQSTSQYQDSARYAVEYLDRNIILADFWGSLKPSVNSGAITYATGATPASGTGCANAAWIVNPGAGIQGYDGTSMTAASGFSAGDSTLATCIGSAGTYVAGSDVVAIRSVNPDCYLPTVAATATPALSDISHAPAAPGNCSSSYGPYWLRTNLGTSGVLFNITTGTTVTAAISAIAGDAPNGVLNYQYQATVFYLATTDSGQGSTPTLYMATLRNPTSTAAQTAAQLYPQPLVDGVEMLKFEYGIDPNYGAASDTLSISEYLPAASISNWNQVISVRVSMIVRGNAMDNFTDTQTYQMTDAFCFGPSSSSCGAKYTGNEKYPRRLVVREILLRNKVRGP